MTESTSPAVGAVPPRSDGLSKVTGQARYVDDITLPELWHGATVRCTQARAKLLRVDASQVSDPEAVVVTAADVPGSKRLQLIEDDWPVLVYDEVRHPYEAVALVAAPTRDRALAAAAEVRVETEALPAVTSLAAALALPEDEQTVLARCKIARGDAPGLLASPPADALLVEGTYTTGHQEHIYIEPQGMIARWSDGALEIIGSMQCPYYIHHALRPLFGLEAEQLRVRQTVTGGGFGGKEDYPDMLAAHAALLARKAGRPVKIVYERHEDIVATTKRHPSWIRHRTLVAPDGTLLAQDIEVVLDGGAYTTLSPVVLSRAVLHAAGPYRCENVAIRGRVLATNTATNGAFRGFGAPQSAFACERHVDAIGRALRIDPYTLRKHNAYRLGDTTPTGQVLEESVSALECLEKAVEASDFVARWQALEARRQSGFPDDGAALEGIGLALFWHGSGFTGDGEQRMKARAAVQLCAGGKVEVLVASTDFGQGTSTVLAQIVADACGLPLRQVEVVPADTAFVPDSGPTVASRTVMIVGGILRRAAEGLIDALCAFATETKGRPVRFEAGCFRDEEGLELGGLDAVGDDFLAARGRLVVEKSFEPFGPDHRFDDETYTGTAYPAYGWGCDVVELTVDPDTLGVELSTCTAVCDVGKAIHPELCKGQVEGGTLQALAWGFMEDVQLEDGRYLNDRLATYIIPTTRDVPKMHAILVENPTAFGPYGAKGVGELPMDGGAPAVLAAIENATGIAPVTVPATPERLFADLCAGRVLPGTAHALAEEKQW